MIHPQIREVSENIFCVRRPSYLNCFYVVKDSSQRGSSAFFIDAGMRADAYDVQFALRRLEIAALDLRAVMITHWHGDHSAGAAYLQKESSAPVYAGLGDKPWLSESSPAGWGKRLLDRCLPEIGPLVLLRGHMGLSVPQLEENPQMKWLESDTLIADRFLAIHTPGHSPGHFAYLDQKSGTLFSGDALAAVDQNLALMASFVTPDKIQAQESALKLAQFEWNSLCPGHRYPLTDISRERKDRFFKQLAETKSWPQWGLLK